MFAQLTQAQANYLKAIRNMADNDRKSLKADLFTIVKDKFGIPSEHKLKVEVDNVSSPDYLVLIRKSDSSRYELGLDGRWDGAVYVPPSAPAVRYFHVPVGAVSDSLADYVEGSDTTWDDGVDLSDIDGVVGTQPDLFGGRSYVVTSDAQLYVAMTEDSF